MPFRSLALAAFIVALLLPATASAQTKGLPDPQYELKGEALIEALRGGGYTLLFRHAARGLNVSESNVIVMDDCSTQIPLAPLGHAQAQSAGEAIRKLGIPIGESIASPFCRTMDTARHIAGHARADKVVLGLTADNTSEPVPFARLVEIMATPPARGTNRVIVGHNTAFTETEGGPYLQEGESAVFKAIDRKRVLVARVRIEDWQAYAAAANKLPQAARSSAPDTLLQHRGTPLIGTIRFGGYTIYIRHGGTDAAQKNKPGSSRTADCNTQRSLSDAASEQARAIGIAFATMRLTVSELIASPSCRALETARLVGRTDAVRLLAGPESVNDISPLGNLLVTPAPRSGVRVIVGDAESFNAVAGPPMLEEGESVVWRTTDAGGWVILARLPAAEWTGMPVAAGFPPLENK